MDRRLARSRDRVRRRLVHGTSRTPGRSSRAPAFGRASATAPRRPDGTGRGAPVGVDRAARRDRAARMGPVRRRRPAGVAGAARSDDALGALARFDRQTIAERIDELSLCPEEHDVLTAELESLAHAPLDQAGAVSVLRWHALSGYSLELTQFTGGRRRSSTAPGRSSTRSPARPVRAPARHDRGRDHAIRRSGRGGDARRRGLRGARGGRRGPAQRARCDRVHPGPPEDKRGAIALGQASRGIKYSSMPGATGAPERDPGRTPVRLPRTSRSTATARS